MKNKLLILLFLSVFTNVFAQKKVSVEFGLGQQIIKKDIGFYYKGGINYKFSNKSSVSIFYGKSELNNKDLDIKYNLIAYDLNYNYGILVSENSSFESILGLSYLNFSNDIVLDDNNGIGINLGARANYDLKKDIGIGFYLINTYSNISPGGIMSGGILFRYNF